MAGGGPTEGTVSDTTPVELPLGYTTRPRDSFIFHALVHGLVTIPDVRVRPVITTLPSLVSAAGSGRLLATKLPVFAFGRLRHRFIGLRAGATFSRDAGPLIVARSEDTDLAEVTVAVDSQHSTAALLLHLLLPFPVRTAEIVGGSTVEAIVDGEYEAAVIAGPELDAYPEHSLPTIDDLGAAWQRQTGLPLPHEVLVVRRDLGPTLAMRLDRGIRESVAYAREHPEESAEHVRKQSSGLSDDAVAADLDTYVSVLTEDLSGEGEDGIEELFARSGARGLIPRSERPPFVPRRTSDPADPRRERPPYVPPVDL